jgi:hypothetical protein
VGVRKHPQPRQCERPNDLFHNTFDIRQHLVIPESDNPITFRIEPRRSSRIGDLPFIVLAAINLNDQLRTSTAKIRDIRTDRNLFSKMIAIDLAATNV